MSDDYTLSRTERDNLIKYDFVPVYSDDDIEKWAPLLAFAGKAATAGRAALAAGKAAGKGLLQTGKKVAVAGKDKLVQGAGKVAETSQKVAEKAGQMRESAQGSKFGQKVSGANDWVKNIGEKAKEKITDATGGGEGEGASTGGAGMAVLGAQQMMAGNAQKKQAQEQRAMDMARRGANIATGEPMDMAWRMLKGE